MQDAGWVKFYRSIFEHWVGSDPHAFHIWGYLLCRANWKAGKLRAGESIIDIERGMVVTSIKRIAEIANCDRKTVSRVLNALENDKMITQKRHNKGTLITICNYSRYQDDEIPDGTSNAHQKGTQSPTKRDTIEEREERKEGKEETNTSKTQAAEPPKRCQDLLKIWNDHCGVLPKCRVLSKSRISKARTRLKERTDLGEWQALIENLASSEFAKNGRWATFDWIIKNDTNHIKAFEGAYNSNGINNKDPLAWADGLEDGEM